MASLRRIQLCRIWLLAVAACLPLPSRASNALTVGFAKLPPLTYDRGDGVPAGFVVEVLNVAARREGITLSWAPIDGDPGSALQDNKIDLWLSAAELGGRKDQFYVSAPWWSSELLLLTPADGGLFSTADMPGKYIAYPESPPIRALAQRYLRLQGAILVSRPTQEAAVVSCCEWKADAVFLDELSLHRVLLSRPAPCRETIFRVISLPGAKLELSLVARRARAKEARRLRARIDELAAGGVLGAIAARYPPAPSRGNEQIAAVVLARRHRNLLLSGLGALVLALLVSAMLLLDLRAAAARQRQAEAELKKSQIRLARAQRLASLGNWEMDCRTWEAEWSEEVYRILGVAETVSKPDLERFLDCVHPEDRERIEAGLRRVAGAGDPYETEHRIVRPDGTERWVREHAEPLRDAAGAIVGLVGTIQDITEYRRLEEQFREAQKLESIGQLAGGIAHDFNNLLTVINGYSDLALEFMTESDPLRANLEEIRKAGERAAGLTQQLLAFSRRQMVQPVVINVNSVIADAEKMLRRLVGEHIKLETALDAALGLVKADAGLITQVLMNLVVNARDAMPNGGRLVIETANVDVDENFAQRHHGLAPGRYVLLGVSDTGVGMDEQTKARIFEPFFTTKPKGAGTGLGLATVYGIVKQAGGWIWVYSKPGEGTAFKILLPRTDERSPVEEAATQPAESLQGTETVLVVEDGDEVRRLMSQILTGYGYKVVEAGSGEEALRICRYHLGPVHLMITDVIMPGMSGRELAGRARPLRPEMKVLFTSGYTDNLIAPQGVLGPDVVYLPKPFAPQALAAKVREVLGPRQRSPMKPAGERPGVQ